MYCTHKSVSSNRRSRIDSTSPVVIVGVDIVVGPFRVRSITSKRVLRSHVSDLSSKCSKGLIGQLRTKDSIHLKLSTVIYNVFTTVATSPRIYSTVAYRGGSATGVDHPQAPGISLFRYGHNGDGLASKKCPMCDRNGDENGSKFRMVRYYVGTRGDRR